MKSKAIRFLEAHQSGAPSTFTEEARWRQDNEPWLKMSQRVALCVISFMLDHGLSRSETASLIGVTPQYMSRIISGRENFSIKTIAKIETTLGITIFPVHFQ